MSALAGGITFLLSLFAAVRILLFVATDLGINLGNETLGIVVVVSFIIAVLAAYIVGNLYEGQKPKQLLTKIRGTTSTFGLFALILILISLSVWGLISFVLSTPTWESFASSTPAWALVIIVLLVLILLK